MCISRLKTQGTGTQIGDSTEIKAIGAVFRHVRSPKAPLYVWVTSPDLIHHSLIVETVALSKQTWDTLKAVVV